MVLETKRLILRPFEMGDAEDLYAWAKDPGVGLAAGWPPHGSVEESREIIRTVFSAPNTFALVDREGGHVIGSAGFIGTHRTRLPGPDDELGYALACAFWGRGLMTEAAAELVRFGFETLGLNTIWCAHYQGNERSRRVMEKCGFRRRFSQEEEVPLLGERRLTHCYALTREEFENAECGQG